eukprot:6480147-Amphidinium_carterae.2
MRVGCRPAAVDEVDVVVLDVFGKPNKKFYEKLALFATDETEQQQLDAIAAGHPASPHVAGGLLEHQNPNAVGYLIFIP